MQRVWKGKMRGEVRGVEPWRFDAHFRGGSSELDLDFVPLTLIDHLWLVRPAGAIYDG